MMILSYLTGPALAVALALAPAVGPAVAPGYVPVPFLTGPEPVLRVAGLGDIPLVLFQVTPPGAIDLRGPTPAPYEATFVIDPAANCSNKLRDAQRSREVFKNAELDIDKVARYTFQDVVISSFHAASGYTGAASTTESFTLLYESATIGGNLGPQGACG